MWNDLNPMLDVDIFWATQLTLTWGVVCTKAHSFFWFILFLWGSMPFSWQIL